MGKYLPFQFPPVIFIAWLMRQKLTENIQMAKKQKFYISTFAKAQKNLVFVKLVGAIDNNLLDVDRKKRPQNFWPISNKNGHFDKGELL